MTDTTVEVLVQDMDEGEGARLIELEARVHKAMRAAGKIAGAALREIRDFRLYRASHASFEQYCLDRFDGMSRSTAYRLITISEAAGELGPAVKAISDASVRAIERRHETLDQPPTVLDPEPEELEDDDDALLGVPEPTPLHRTNEKKRLATGKPEGAPPQEERSSRLGARAAINRIMNAIDAVDPAAMKMVVEVSTVGERRRIIHFAEPFAAIVDEERRRASRPEGVVDPNHCDHPIGRRIGSQCGKCGAVRKPR